MDTAELLRKMKAAASGMQSIEVYHEYYEISRHLKSGHILDVGTGQGGSTIAYALGLKENEHLPKSRVFALDQFYQHESGPHPFSLKSNPDNCVDLNIAAFNRNLKAFGVNDIVTIYPGAVETLPSGLKGEDVGILSLDTDGYIDRDFELFFDSVVPEGEIVIDDCVELVNSYGRRNLEAVRGMGKASAEKFVAKRRKHRLSGGARILGKHFLAYKLTQYYVSKGLLEIEKVYGSTAFCTKSTTKPYALLTDPADIEEVKLSVEKEFLRRAVVD